MDRYIWLSKAVLQPRIHSLVCWRQNLLYQGSPDDLFIVSYPRSGASLLQMLLYQIVVGHGGDQMTHINEFSPLIDKLIQPRSRWTLQTLPAPRRARSSLPYRLIPKGPGRYIYLMRNGLDVAISNYWRLRLQGYQESQLKFLDLYMRGTLPGGTWFEHVRGWTRNSKRLRVCYVTYEDLCTDFVATARRVAAFCGITVAESDWQRIAQNCSFETMRRHEHKFHDGQADDRDEAHFVRRGQAGDWREWVDSATVRRFNTECARAFRGIDVPACLSAYGANHP